MTDPGRVVGVVTMTVGVVLFGALTAFLANAFIRPPANEGASAGADHADLRAELAEIRRELRALRDEGATIAANYGSFETMACPARAHRTAIVRPNHSQAKC